MNNKYITISLPNDQARQLGSIIGDAYMVERTNCLFIASAAPDSRSWRMQLLNFPCRFIRNW